MHKKIYFFSSKNPIYAWLKLFHVNLSYWYAFQFWKNAYLIQTVNHEECLYIEVPDCQHFCPYFQCPGPLLSWIIYYFIRLEQNTRTLTIFKFLENHWNKANYILANFKHNYQNSLILKQLQLSGTDSHVHMYQFYLHVYL